MRTLTATLLAAQKLPTATPAWKLEVHNKIAGVERFLWTRLYTGSEPDSFHAAAMPADGSLTRVRVSADVLYRQRVQAPGPGSDFTAWLTLGGTIRSAVAACASGVRLAFFYLSWSGSAWQLYCQESTDYGATYDGGTLVATDIDGDLTNSTPAPGMAAVYYSASDIALFLQVGTGMSVYKRVSGVWGAGTGWGKATGALSGVGAALDGTLVDLAVTGKDSGGDHYILWVLTYNPATGAFSALQPIAQAPTDASVEYQRPFLDKPDQARIYYVENFTGQEAQARPFFTHAVPGTAFAAGLAREPAPFNLSSSYSLALVHDTSYVFLTRPDGVWRSPLSVASANLSANIVALREDIAPKATLLTVELDNTTGQFASPGSGSLAALRLGSELRFSPGYFTTAGAEYSDGPAYWIQAFSYRSTPGQALFVLEAEGALGLLSRWTARHQFRWNKDPASPEKTIWQMLQFLLSRAGLALEAVSQSSVMTSFQPDFTIHPRENGSAILSRLLNMVPDVLYARGATLRALNPQASDAAAYAYGGSGEHPITQGLYRTTPWPTNRVRAEGLDVALAPVSAETADWTEIANVLDRLALAYDINLTTIAQAQDRGAAILREQAIHSLEGEIMALPHAGQELHDVVAITDARAGLAAAKRRIGGLLLDYDARRGVLAHRLTLAAP